MSEATNFTAFSINTGISTINGYEDRFRVTQGNPNYMHISTNTNYRDSNVGGYSRSFQDLSGVAYNQQRGTYPDFQESFDTFMSSRNNDLYISPDEGGLSEEDVLCNTHLRTAGLFKGYSAELKLVQSEYNALINDEEIMTKSLKDYKTSMSNIRLKVVVYHPKSSDTLISNNLVLDRSMGSIELAVMNEIQTKKSTLDARIDVITKKLNALRALIHTGLQDIVNKDDTASKKMCAICFDREVDTVMVPCGHTACTGCANYNHTGKCMHCRSYIQKTVKLYFSM